LADVLPFPLVQLAPLAGRLPAGGLFVGGTAKGRWIVGLADQVSRRRIVEAGEADQHVVGRFVLSPFPVTYGAARDMKPFGHFVLCPTSRLTESLQSFACDAHSHQP